MTKDEERQLEELNATVQDLKAQWNELIKKGIKKVTTHISGSNYGVLNLEVKEFGYKVVNSFVVLRKIYKS